jgi:hypothetical protein
VAFLVIGDRALADELGRALSPLGEDVAFAVSFFEEALPTPLSAVVLSESTTREQAAIVGGIVRRAQGGMAPVWLIATAGVDAPPDDAFIIVPRAGLLPAARTLIGASEKHRVPVQILARWRRSGEEEAAKKLVNVVGLSERAMIVESDDALNDGDAVDVTFIIPGAAHRVALGGVVRDYVDQRRGLRKVELVRVEAADQGALRQFLQRRLAR